MKQSMKSKSKPAGKSSAAAISMRPENAEQTGLFNDARGRIVRAAWVRFTYPNSGQETLALELEIQPLNTKTGKPEKGVENYTQDWSAGSLDRLVPSKDGNHVMRAEGSKANGLPAGCNAVILLDSLTKAGLKSAKLDAGVGPALVGLDCHWLRIPAPKRSGLMTTAEGGGDAKPKTILTVSEIYGSTAAKAGKPAPDEDEDIEDEDTEEAEESDDTEDGEEAEDEEADTDEDDDEEEEEEDSDDEEAEDEDDISSLAEKAVSDALSAAGGKLPKAKVYSAAFKTVAKHPKRKLIVEQMQDDDWFADGDRPWRDGDIVSLRKAKK